jgi:hypothetical protein
MLRSALVPGWGQAYNGSWLKAVGVAVGEIGLAFRIRDDQRTLNRLDRDANQARVAGDLELEAELIDAYNSRLDGYTARQWFLAGLFTYALVDAYIDAHFRNFELEFENDPALPEGVRPGRTARFGLRMAF